MNSRIARRSLEILASKGIPPVGIGDDEILKQLTVGLDSFVIRFCAEYLESLLVHGGSHLRFVVGSYGEGKTHLLKLLLNEAIKRNYLVSYVELSGPTKSLADPLSFYREIVNNLIIPPEPGYPPSRGIHGLFSDLNSRLYSTPNPQESARDLKRKLVDIARRGYALWGIANAIYAGCLYCNDVSASDKLPLVEAFEDYLKGHPPSIQSLPRRIRSDYQKYVGSRPTKKTAILFLRSLCSCARAAGYAGIVVGLDEADPELTWKMGRMRKQVPVTLRQLVDQVAEMGIPGTAFIYGILPEFEEVFVTSYDAIAQRILRPQAFRDRTNPRATVVRIQDIDEFRTNLENRYREISRRLEGLAESAGMLINLEKKRRIENFISDYAVRVGGGQLRPFIKKVSATILSQ